MRCIRSIIWTGLLISVLAGAGDLAAEPQADCCDGARGNVNNVGSDMPDLSDLSLLISYLTAPAGDRPILPCFLEADLNADGRIDMGDLSCFIARIMIFPQPPCLVNCPPE
jgi:hypothetical protein